jgi:predicted transcriptional regulator
MTTLGSLEQQVMAAVWGQPPATVREVCGRLQGVADRAYTTILTTLDRLHRKGLVERAKINGAWVYSAAAEGRARTEADALAAALLAHGPTGLLALVEQSPDEATLDQLAALIAARRGATGGTP